MNVKKGIMYVLIANIINLAITLITGFILPKYLSIDTYSDIKLFQLYITYIGIMHLGYSDGMYLQHGGKNIRNISKKETANEFATFKLFQFVVSLLCIVFCLIINNKILLFCSIAILPINIGNYIRNLYSAIGEFKKYSRFTNINTMFMFVINLMLLFIIKTDESNVYIIGYLLTYFIYWLIIEIEHKKLFGKHKAVVSKKFLYRDIKNGFFLMIGGFCNVIFTTIDRLFVKELFDKVQFAYYSFAVSIENLMSVFITPISTTLYNYFCNNNKKENVLKVKRLILIFSTFIIAFLFPAKFLVEIYLTKYSNSLVVLVMLFAAQYISIMVRCVHINLYKAEKKQTKYFIIMISVVLLSVILNILFYSFNNSIEAIALATLVTNTILFIVGEIDFRKYKLKFVEYLYVFLIMGIFLMCCRLDTILGFVLYVGLAAILTILVLNDTIKICFKEFKHFIKRFRTKVEIEN